MENICKRKNGGKKQQEILPFHFSDIIEWFERMGEYIHSIYLYCLASTWFMAGAKKNKNTERKKNPEKYQNGIEWLYRDSWTTFFQWKTPLLFFFSPK